MECMDGGYVPDCGWKRSLHMGHGLGSVVPFGAGGLSMDQEVGSEYPC